MIQHNMTYHNKTYYMIGRHNIIYHFVDTQIAYVLDYVRVVHLSQNAYLCHQSMEIILAQFSLGNNFHCSFLLSNLHVRFNLSFEILMPLCIVKIGLDIKNSSMNDIFNDSVVIRSHQIMRQKNASRKQKSR